MRKREKERKDDRWGRENRWESREGEGIEVTVTRKVGKVAEATIGRSSFPLGGSSGSRALGHCLHVDPYFALSSPPSYLVDRLPFLSSKWGGNGIGCDRVTWRGREPRIYYEPIERTALSRGRRTRGEKLMSRMMGFLGLDFDFEFSSRSSVISKILLTIYKQSS